MSIIDTNIIDAMWIDEDNDLWLAIYDDLFWDDSCDPDSGIGHVMLLIRKFLLYKNFLADKTYEKTFPASQYPIDDIYIAYYAEEGVTPLMSRVIGEFECGNAHFNIVYNAYELEISKGETAVENIYAVEGVENQDQQERLTYNRNLLDYWNEGDTLVNNPALWNALIYYHKKCGGLHPKVEYYEIKPLPESFFKRIFKKFFGKKS